MSRTVVRLFFLGAIALLAGAVVMQLLDLPRALRMRKARLLSLVYDIQPPAGGVSDDLSDLSGKMARILKDRIDPDGSHGVMFRPQGPTRLEVSLLVPEGNDAAIASDLNRLVRNQSAEMVPARLADAPPSERFAAMQVSLMPMLTKISGCLVGLLAAVAGLISFSRKKGVRNLFLEKGS